MTIANLKIGSDEAATTAGLYLVQLLLIKDRAFPIDVSALEAGGFSSTPLA